jgi:hypothetical protein
MKELCYGNVRSVDMVLFSRWPGAMAEAAKLRRDDLFTFIFVSRIVGDKVIIGIHSLAES